MMVTIQPNMTPRPLSPEHAGDVPILRRKNAIRRIAYIQGVILAALSILFAWLGLSSTRTPPHFLLAAIFLMGALVQVIAGRISRTSGGWLAVWVSLVAFHLLAIGYTTVVEGVVWIMLAILWVYTLLVAAETLTPRNTNWAVLLVMMSTSICFVVDLTSTIQSINQPEAALVSLIVLVLLVLVYAILLIRNFHAHSLQIKLVTVLLIATLAPFAVLRLLFPIVNPALLMPFDWINRLSIQPLITVIAQITAVLAAGMGIVLAILINRPIVGLTKAVSGIAHGNLETIPPGTSTGEMGFLAEALNQMTVRLRHQYGSMETRVSEQTQDLVTLADRLNHRAVQIQTIGEVARSITALQQIEDLLPSLCGTIAERIGSQSVSIYHLMEDQPDIRVWTAALDVNGSYHSTVGNVERPPGVVEKAITTRLPQIIGPQEAASSIGEDTATSQMALPLKIGADVIGAIQITQRAGSSFTEEDSSLFHTLADQIAVGIENSHLMARTQYALDEVQQLNRKYLRNEWSAYLAEQGCHEYHYRSTGHAPAPADRSGKEILRAVETKAASIRAEPAADGKPARTGLAVPILLRGEPIGAIDLLMLSPDRQWTEDDIYIVQKTAAHLALILENARLVDKTVRRIERERKVVEITGKIRASPDPQAMLRTALDELRKTLGPSRTQPPQAEDTTPD